MPQEDITNLAEAVCLVGSAILASQINCKPNYYWILLCSCAVISLLFVVGNYMGITALTTGPVGTILTNLHIMAAGAFAFEIFYVKANHICSSNTFFDGALKFQVLYLLNIIGLCFMIRSHVSVK